MTARDELPELIFSVIYIVLLRIMKNSKFKKTLEMDEVDARIDRTRTELEMTKNKTIINYLNDKSIKIYMCFLIAMFFVLSFIIPWSVKNSVNNQHEFNIVNYDGTNYVLVYYDETSSFLKKCVICNESIRIERDSFMIKESGNIEYQIMSFNSVDITEID